MGESSDGSNRQSDGPMGLEAITMRVVERLIQSAGEFVAVGPLADEIGVSRRRVYDIVNILSSVNYLVRSDDRQSVRPSQDFLDMHRRRAGDPLTVWAQQEAGKIIDRVPRSQLALTEDDIRATRPDRPLFVMMGGPQTQITVLPDEPSAGLVLQVSGGNARVVRITENGPAVDIPMGRQFEHDEPVTEPPVNEGGGCGWACSRIPEDPGGCGMRVMR